jgi:HNH endonuclease
MIHVNRYDRCVVTTRTDGVFDLNQKKVWARSYMRIEHRLDVCQNCLDHLRWEGFSIQARSSVRAAIVASFSLANFFLKYGAPIFKQTPKYSDQDAPMNEYSADFSNVSNQTRASCNWTCENCGVNLSSASERQYLHVHHKKRVKSDNAPSNLIALCVACHALQPGHTHLQWSRDFRQFLASHPTRAARGFRSQVA